MCHYFCSLLKTLLEARFRNRFGRPSRNPPPPNAPTQPGAMFSDQRLRILQPPPRWIGSDRERWLLIALISLSRIINRFSTHCRTTPLAVATSQPAIPMKTSPIAAETLTLFALIQVRAVSAERLGDNAPANRPSVLQVRSEDSVGSSLGPLLSLQGFTL